MASVSRDTSLRRVLRRSGMVLLVLATVGVLWADLSSAAANPGRAVVDFHPIWLASKAIVHGESPYPTIQHLAAMKGGSVEAYVYPPLAAVLLVPLAYLGWSAIAIPLIILNGVLVALALRALGVRDWRCYAAALIALPTIRSMVLGAIGPLLLILLVAAWKERDRHPRIAGLAVGLAVALKLFLAPVIIWLLVARRFRSASWALGSTALFVALSWFAISLHGLSQYPTLLSTLTRIEASTTDSTLALAHRLGLPWPLVAAACIAPLVLVIVRPQREADAFAAAIAISLLATPILWTHYLVLLYAPIALRSRTLNYLWLIPLALWLWPTPETPFRPASLAHIGLCLAVVAITCAPPSLLATLRSRRVWRTAPQR